MRYYMYIDRDFLKGLISVSGNIDFDIQVIEYSVQSSCTNRNDMAVRPCIEKICDSENETRIGEDKAREKRYKNNGCDKNSVGISYENSVINNISTEKKYINIQDITDMKNINFYHNMLESIRQNSRGETGRIFEEFGNMESEGLDRNCNIPNSECKIFKINNTYMWYDSSKLVSDMNFLCNIACKVNVIGYEINSDEIRGVKIAKVIAIFID